MPPDALKNFHCYHNSYHMHRKERVTAKNKYSILLKIIHVDSVFSTLTHYLTSMHITGFVEVLLEIVDWLSDKGFEPASSTVIMAHCNPFKCCYQPIWYYWFYSYKRHSYKRQNCSDMLWPCIFWMHSSSPQCLQYPVAQAESLQQRACTQYYHTQTYSYWFKFHSFFTNSPFNIHSHSRFHSKEILLNTSLPVTLRETHYLFICGVPNSTPTFIAALT